MKHLKVFIPILIVLTVLLSCSMPGDETPPPDNIAGDTDSGNDTDTGDDQDSTSYTITFNKADADAVGTMEAQIVESGESVTLIPNTFTREDYSFAGWSLGYDPYAYYESEEEAMVDHTDQASITVNSDTTLYAVWYFDPEPALSITFNSNGGTGTMSPQSPLDVEEGTTFNLKSNTFFKQFHSFVGWSTDSGSEVVEYVDKAAYTMGSSSETLYALWAPIEYRELIDVSGGTFTQEEAASTALFDHTVSDFKIGQYQVTYELWYHVRIWGERNGYNFAGPDPLTYPHGTQGNSDYDEAPITSGEGELTDRYKPVTHINWRKAIVWANAYSEMSGLTPVYTYNGEIIKDSNANDGGVEISWMNVVEKWTTANGYRLPSEGEWQYAASYKDGSSWTDCNSASGATDGTLAATQQVAQTGSISSYALPVGQKDPNQLNIYDMSGNVSEWCWDSDGDYPSSAQTDYRGAFPVSAGRIRRGGPDASPTVSHVRVGERITSFSYQFAEYVGLRVARSIIIE
ncbi:MAG: SUMF1/EgtB/PvdO family nonheme iron enzyme [Spirochaetales bacterium]|nr:SUMF1/EgtB/PvdO family nonheme iron enzyme [Spirochaetales bacterium]